MRNAVVVGAAVLLVSDALLIKKLYLETREEKVALQALQGQFDSVPDSARIAIVDSFPGSKLSLISLLRPRKCLMIDTDILDNEKIANVLDLYGADLIISDREDGESLFNWKMTGTVTNAIFSETLYWYTPGE